MLHTLYSLSEMQEKANIVLAQQHYNTFDSREFRSALSMEDSFKAIRNDFLRLWDKTILPFINSLVNGTNEYSTKAKSLTLIPEEAIYLMLQNLSANNITSFHSITGLRLIGLTSDEPEDSSLSVLSSPVYDPLHKCNYSVITIILYSNIFSDYKNNPEVFNRILLRLANTIALNYLDDQLRTRHNVNINRVYTGDDDFNKDAIILPELFNISDGRFLFSYFYTLFNIVQSILNRSYLTSFTDYSHVISLPNLFMFDMTEEEMDYAESKMSTMSNEEAALYALGIRQKLYKRIWDCAYSDKEVDDNTYVDICSEIISKLNVNLDMSYYEAESEFAQENEEEQKDQEEYAEESQYSNIDNDEYTTEEESDGSVEGPTT